MTAGVKNIFHVFGNEIGMYVIGYIQLLPNHIARFCGNSLVVYNVKL